MCIYSYFVSRTECFTEMFFDTKEDLANGHSIWKISTSSSFFVGSILLERMIHGLAVINYYFI